MPTCVTSIVAVRTYKKNWNNWYKFWNAEEYELNKQKCQTLQLFQRNKIVFYRRLAEQLLKQTMANRTAVS